MKQSTHISLSTGTIIRAVLVVLGFVALYYVRNTVLLVLTALVLAAALEPIVNWFVVRKMPRVAAVIGIYILLAAVIVGAFYFLVIPLLSETADFLGTLPENIETVDVYSPAIESGIAGAESLVVQVPQALSLSDIAHELNTFSEQFSAGALSIITKIFGGFASFILVIVLSFYLVVQHDGIQSFLRTIIPPTHRDYALDLWKRSERKIGLWMQGQLLLIVLVGFLTYIGLSLLGVKYAVLLGVLAGALELIPLFGPIIAAIPAVLIAYTTGDYTFALIVAGLYVFIQQFENQILYPYVVRKVVGVPALIVIVALIIGAQLAGFLGIILSVPVAATLMEVYKDMQKRQLEEGQAKV